MSRKIILLNILLVSVLCISCERDYEPETSAPDEGTDISGTTWIKSFIAGEKTYYVLFVSTRLKEGNNSLQAYIYLENMKPVTGYRIEIDPRMPDMGNHSSPNNRDLEWNAAKSVYEGAINLTMTGWWRLNLKVYDENGELAGGSAVEGQSSSTLYWDIDI
jgi:hypothetical protein